MIDPDWFRYTDTFNLDQDRSGSGRSQFAHRDLADVSVKLAPDYILRPCKRRPLLNVTETSDPDSWVLMTIENAGATPAINYI